MPVLEYTGGKNPHENLEKFVSDLKKQFTNISDDDVRAVIKMATLGVDARQKRRTITLFGRDIMTEDVESIPVWKYLAPSHQRRILEHPVDTGERVDFAQDKVSQLELVGRLDRRSVNRSVLVSPRGLERTYVFSQRTRWQQDVTQKDADLIFSKKSLRRLFRNVDQDGPFIPVRSYGGPIVTSRHIARDSGDVRALRKEFSRSNHFSGADLKKGS